MKKFKKVLIETIIAVLCLLPILIFGYMIGEKLNQTIF
jgi:hypothetical protein